MEHFFVICLKWSSPFDTSICIYAEKQVMSILVSEWSIPSGYCGFTIRIHKVYLYYASAQTAKWKTRSNKMAGIYLQYARADCLKEKWKEQNGVI